MLQGGRKGRLWTPSYYFDEYRHKQSGSRSTMREEETTYYCYFFYYLTSLMSSFLQDRAARRAGLSNKIKG